MEKLIRLMANGRTISEQTNMVERVSEMVEFAGVTMACIIVLMAMTIF